ncbi:MAG: hypothetical protein GXP49_17800 [Deltaproteobacteria bacterium]|nr:hypothetical protein [Deltaproteobacteria bacterium]
MNVLLYLEDTATLLALLAFIGGSFWLSFSLVKQLSKETPIKKWLHLSMEIAILAGQTLLFLSLAALLVITLLRWSLELEKPMTAALLVSAEIIGAIISALAAFKTLHRILGAEKKNGREGNK